MDLRFRLFGVDVRIHPLFWLITAMLGWNATKDPLLPGNGLGDLAVWMLAVFLSILLHEFGHIWMGQVFGSRGHIVLHGMGGLAVGATASQGWKRILICAAGPAIQLVLFAILVSALLTSVIPLPDRLHTPVWEALKWIIRTIGILLPPGGEMAPGLQLLLMDLLYINLLWPIVNLLPVWPLDGGQITREVCVGVTGQRGILISLWISFVVGVTLAINALLGPSGKAFIPYAPTSMWMAILFALFALSSWQAIQFEQARQRESYGDDLPWER
jgi:Zn-dependent protease